MKDKDLCKITKVFKDLNVITKNVNTYENVDKAYEEMYDIVEQLFARVNGKINKESINYNTYTVASAIEIEGDVNGYDVCGAILLNDRHFGLSALVEDLTMAYWRAVLKREDYDTLALIEQILTS